MRCKGRRLAFPCDPVRLRETAVNVPHGRPAIFVREARAFCIAHSFAVQLTRIRKSVTAKNKMRA
jgi:hypothetical protein